MKLHKNVYLWYITTLLSYAAFTLPIWVIFNRNVLGFSYTQAFILGVLAYGLSAVFEVPTGSWADKYGRARIYQYGTVLYILSVASYIFFKSFGVLIVFQILGGLGLAMQSGSLEALVHDSLEVKDKDIVYSQIHGRKMAVLFISRVLTVLFSGVMFTINPRLPFVVAVITYILGLIVSLFFKDVRVESATTASNFSHIKETFSIMIKKSMLPLFFMQVALYIFLSEALFALYQPYFQSLKIKIGEFGIFYAIISICSAIGALSITGLAKRKNVFKIQLFMMLAVLFTLAAMLFRVPAFTYLVIIPSAVAFGFSITLQNTITQKLVSSKHQATAVSIASFVRTFSFLMSVVVVGILLDTFNVSTVNTILASLTAVLVVPFLVSYKRKITI